MNRNWTREETIIAFNVYCKIPFKDSNKNHPMIKKYAKQQGFIQKRNFSIFIIKNT